MIINRDKRLIVKLVLVLLVNVLCFDAHSIRNSVSFNIESKNNAVVDVSFQGNDEREYVFVPIILRHYYYIEFKFLNQEKPRFIGIRGDWGNTIWDIKRLNKNSKYTETIDLSTWFVLEKDKCYEMMAKYYVKSEQYSEKKYTGFLGLPVKIWSGTLYSNTFQVCL
jgi:hypothetical protein